MSQASDQLQAMIPRLEAFLDRLTERANQVAEEAKAAVAEMRTSGDSATETASYSLQAGIGSQIQGLIDKGNAVFDEQFRLFQDIDDPATERLYEQLTERMESWEESLESLVDQVFNSSDHLDAQAKWDAGVADWRAAASRFSCSQCGAPVPVPGLFGVAVYLPCQGCGANATFIPSTAMVWAVQVADMITPAPDDPKLMTTKDTMKGN